MKKKEKIYTSLIIVISASREARHFFEKKANMTSSKNLHYDELKLNSVEFIQRTKLPIEIPFLYWSVIKFVF